ncbi:MAG: hypothetical protein ACN4GZ_17570 [Acidimicrobiales bacterium]
METIEAERFVMRLDTHSSHRLLARDQRHEVRSALIEAFGHNSRLRVDYETRIYTTRRLL